MEQPHGNCDLTGSNSGQLRKGSPACHWKDETSLVSFSLAPRFSPFLSCSTKRSKAAPPVPSSPSHRTIMPSPSPPPSPRIRQTNSPRRRASSCEHYPQDLELQSLSKYTRQLTVTPYTSTSAPVPHPHTRDSTVPPPGGTFAGGVC